MTLQVGDILFDHQVDAEIKEGEDFRVELELYESPGSDDDCGEAALGDPRSLANESGVFIEARDEGSERAIRGAADIISVGSATVPARVRARISNSEVKIALAQADTTRLIVWTLYSFNTAAETTAHLGGELHVAESGSGGT